VAGWHDTGVPKAITANDVQRLLDSCDISDPAGVRDYAILMLVARVGLRSIEVARLQLDDLDWRAGAKIGDPDRACFIAPGPPHPGSMRCPPM